MASNFGSYNTKKGSLKFFIRGVQEIMKFKFIPWPLRIILRGIRNLKTRFALRAFDEKSLILKIREKNLTNLSDKNLIALLESLKQVNDNGIPGIFVEAGVALGGTLCVISKSSKSRKIYAYDTFEMIPPPSENDPQEVHERYNIIKSGKSEGIGGDIYYGYRSDLLEFVSKNVEMLCGRENLNHIEFYKGLLQNTMDVGEQVAFAHIDVDWYEPVKHSVKNIWPLLSVGGVIIFDDYYDWGGCKKAVDEFFFGRNDFEFDSTGRNLKVTKLIN